MADRPIALLVARIVDQGRGALARHDHGATVAQGDHDLGDGAQILPSAHGLDDLAGGELPGERLADRGMLPAEVTNGAVEGDAITQVGDKFVPERPFAQRDRPS